MAKAGTWLLGAKGKFAGATLQRGINGETIIRERVVPRDPKTPKQMVQRVVHQTVFLAYRLMKEVCNHTFEDLAVGMPNMAYFLKTNIKALRQQVATAEANGTPREAIMSFTPKGTTTWSPNAYLIAQGVLPAVPVSLEGGDASTALMTGLEANTYQAVIDAYGLQRGDCLTFVALHGDKAEVTACYTARLVLDPRLEGGGQAPLTVALVTDDGHVNMPSALNSGSFDVLAFRDGALCFSFDPELMSAAAVIVSRQSGAAWLHSTTRLTTSGSRMPEGCCSLAECLK